MLEGWKCPECGKVHSPYINSCDCYLNNIPINITASSNQWIYMDDKMPQAYIEACQNARRITLDEQNKIWPYIGT